MDPIKIEGAEETLLTAISEGRTAVLGGAMIQAELLRRIVLGLPVAGKDNSVWGEVRRMFGRAATCCDSPRTPVGISILDAVIDGDLDLTSVTGENGGPMCPLAFENSRFQGRFLGAYARFSRLSFTGCTFVDPGEGDSPTIDLAGAAIGSDLQMRGIRPYGFPAHGVGPQASQGNYLRVKLKGVRVDGAIDLCHSHLRARGPKKGANPIENSADGNDALDLALAEVKGDIQFLWGISDGRIKIRSAHISGDIWMTGAALDNPHESWLRGQALTLQGTRVGGFVMLDGGPQNMNGTGQYRTFQCRGKLKMEAAEIGRSLYLQDAMVRGAIEAPLLSVRDDLFLHAEVAGPIDLTGCRVGGSLDISRLNLAAEVGKVILKDGSIGRTLSVAPPAPLYRYVSGRRRVIDPSWRINLVETLWEADPARQQGDDESPARYRHVRAAFLTVGVFERFAKIYHLDGHGEVLERVMAGLPSGRAAEPARDSIRKLSASYVLTGEGPMGPDDDSGRLENGLFVLPRGEKSRKMPDDWFPIGCWQNLPSSVPLIRRLATFVQPKPLLQARFDLEGLSCDTLRDDGGWAWGKHSDRIEMNHFVYRRADWQVEPSVTRGTGQFMRWLKWAGTSLLAVAGRSARPTLAELWTGRPRSDPAETRRTRSSFQWLLDSLKGIVADYAWLPRTSHLAGVLREESAYLNPWKVRRNWIYRQFPPFAHEQRNLISISRFRIGENEYRSQPFENAIAVARAEGREELAVHFEMLKRRIEWRLFGQWIRWPLAFAAITLSALWLLRNVGDGTATVAALAATLWMMTFVSAIDNRLRWMWHWTRRITREVILYSPAILLLFMFDNWYDKPFPFIIAFLIFVGIRFISFFASVVMRFGFGYLRRPAQALITLIAAFLLGWWGVHVANRHRMLVLAAEPATHMFAPDPSLNYSYEEEQNRYPEPEPLVAVTEKRDASARLVHEISCDPTVSEPLYALDVLIPLIDLHEESRCEIRRVAEGAHSADSAEPAPVRDGKVVAAPERAHEPARHGKPDDRPSDPYQMSLGQLWENLPALTIDYHRFWWWMKALYAVAGWFIVSLALLTFAQVNRTHGEPAESD